MNNILVTGGNGQLGSELKEIASNYPDYNFLFTTERTKFVIIKVKRHAQLTLNASFKP